MILTCFEVHGMADDRTVVVNPHDLGRQGVMQHMSTTWKDGRAHHVMRFNDGHQIVVELESISGPDRERDFGVARRRRVAKLRMH